MSDKPELIQGPLPQFDWDDKDMEQIEQLLSSDDDVNRAYGEAYLNKFFVIEFLGMVSVIEASKIATAAFRYGKSDDEVVESIQLGDLIYLGGHPGRGNTMAEKIIDSMQKALDDRESI